MLCLSRPLFWLKYCFKGFYQTLKTTRRILTRTGRSYDPLSRRLRILLQEAQRNISLAVTLLKNLGFAVNREKTCLIPTQVLKFLRFVIGSTAETLSLLEEKVLKVKCLCMKAISTPTMSARQLASLLAPWIPVVWQYGKHPVISDTWGPSKRLQHLLQHPFDFVECQCWKPLPPLSTVLKRCWNDVESMLKEVKSL